MQGSFQQPDDRYKLTSLSVTAVVVWCSAAGVAFEWTWDSENKSAAAEVSPGEREVRFHINYSSGTAAVRGTQVMADRQYFWEVKMTTPVYGTDMVVCLGR